MRYLLVCYDIADDKRRSRLARRLERWGRRVQFSVFEVACRSELHVDRLQTELRELCEKDDSVRLYYFNKATLRQSGELDGDSMRQCPATLII